MSTILFASMPFDGHFNPLTGLAVHLRRRGHDVRFYTGQLYAEKLARLEIPHFPFVRASGVNALNIEEHFPEYGKLGAGPKAIEFALRHIFFGNIENHYRDICELRGGFPFDALICDGAFYASTLVAEKLERRVYVVWPAQTPAPTGKNVPPPFFGFKPATSILGRARDAIVHALVNRTNDKCRPILNDLRSREGLPPYLGSLWNLHNGTARAMFQVGAPGFDYPRSDWPPQHVFVGALQPHAARSAAAALPGHVEERISRSSSVVVVSQGTVDNRDPEKLIVPTIEGLKDGRHLVIATTGHRHTEALRRRFPQDNVLVEDYLDYEALLPRADLLVSNGGYGSVLFALSKGVPVLAAGRLEGKNDINARLDYCGFGLDLRTERPLPATVRKGVERVLGDAEIRRRVARFSEELKGYDTFGIIEERLARDGIVAPQPGAATRHTHAAG